MEDYIPFNQPSLFITLPIPNPIYPSTKHALSASREVQEQDISPTTLEAAKTLSYVISQKAKSTDKGMRYKRKTTSKSFEKDISTDLDAGIEVNPGSEDFNTGNEDFNIGSLGVSTGSGPVSTPSVVQTINVIIPSPIKSQREGKAPITTEEIQATKRTKAQIQQEEVGLAESIRFQELQEEEAARQVHLDALIAKRISEEEELSEQQKKRKAEVQEAAQYYTEEDWDTIRAKLEANAELTKSLQGESMTSEDFAKRMVEMINQKKKFYAEQKKLTFDELKTEFEKLVKSIENFMPIETDERVKRQGVQLEQEFSKKQKTIEEVSVLEESITESMIAKEEEIEKSVKKRGKIRKQKARKGILIDKTAQDESEEEREAFMKYKITSSSSESKIGIDVIPTATKPPNRKYPLSKDACQVMLKMKLLDGTTDEVCYQLLKMIEKQAGLRYKEGLGSSLYASSVRGMRGYASSSPWDCQGGFGTMWSGVELRVMGLSMGAGFLQNILDLYFKYFKLPEDVVNRILQVVLDLQHFKSSLVIFAATILQSSSAIHHISNIDNYVHQIIEFQSILITSSHSLWSSQSFGHQKGVCPWLTENHFNSQYLKHWASQSFGT
ncbi:hypothetical protein Tco_0012317 [Tanacetum coccineum]